MALFTVLLLLEQPEKLMTPDCFAEKLILTIR